MRDAQQQVDLAVSTNKMFQATQAQRGELPVDRGVGARCLAGRERRTGVEGSCYLLTELCAWANKTTDSLSFACGSPCADKALLKCRIEPGVSNLFTTNLSLGTDLGGSKETEGSAPRGQPHSRQVKRRHRKTIDRLFFLGPSFDSGVAGPVSLAGTPSRFARHAWAWQHRCWLPTRASACK